MTVMVIRLSEPLGPQQSVGEVKHQPYDDEGGERIVEDHGKPPQSRSQAIVYPIDSAKKPSPMASMMTSNIAMLLATSGSLRASKTPTQPSGGDDVPPIAYVFERGAKAAI
jgi:hypothetical protein